MGYEHYFSLHPKPWRVMARRIENEIVEYDLGGNQDQPTVEVRGAPTGEHKNQQKPTSRPSVTAKKHYRVFLAGLFVGLIVIVGPMFIFGSGDTKSANKKKQGSSLIQHAASMRSPIKRTRHSSSHRKRTHSHRKRKRHSRLKRRALGPNRPVPLSTPVPYRRKPPVQVAPARSMPAPSSSSSSSAGDTEFGIE